MTAKIITWNVNGLARKGAIETLMELVSRDPELIFLQETKCLRTPPAVLDALAFADREISLFPAEDAKGHHGTATIVRRGAGVKIENIALPGHPREGRIQLAVVRGLSIVNVYVPNSGVGERALSRLSYRLDRWDPDFAAWVRGRAPDVVVGDLNVAAADADVHAPAKLCAKAGFTPAERSSFRGGLGAWGEDAWTRLRPDDSGPDRFTFFGPYQFAAGRGWRLDYILENAARGGNAVSAIARLLPAGYTHDHLPLEAAVTTAP